MSKPKHKPEDKGARKRPRLKLNRETLKDLETKPAEGGKVKGGVPPTVGCGNLSD
jgi:hypothetical protein